MIFSDASSKGWVAHMGDSQISDVWSLSERKLNITVLDLKAVILALQHWVSVLQGHHVMITTDSTTVEAYINKQGGTHWTEQGLAGTVNVHVSTVFPAQQSHSEAQDDPGGRGDTPSPLVAVTTEVSTLATAVCGPPSIEFR